jgi:hypothetical protein
VKKKPKAMAGVLRPKAYTARTADKYELYQLAVQDAAWEARFARRTYKSMRRGREPAVLREDFCGTALICATWARDRGRCAIGVDLDGDVLAWGLRNNIHTPGHGESGYVVSAKSDELSSRIKLHRADVRTQVLGFGADVTLALNFSYFVFKQRDKMLDYFTSARSCLAPGGIFILDFLGGPGAMEEVEEETKVDGPGGRFTYVWDQHKLTPKTGDWDTRIHFEFRDGSVMRDAFTYDWRLWSLPEIIDILREAGFAHVDTYWEGWTKDGKAGNGIFRKDRSSENCDTWVTYIVASNEGA